MTLPKGHAKPNNANYWYEEGLRYANVQKFEAAYACFDKATLINPDNAGAWYRKGLCSYYLRKFEDAYACFDKVTKLNQDNPYYWHYKGLCSYRLGKLQEAREMLLGHSIGLSNAYYRPDESEVLEEYMKAVDLLTINEENRLKRQVEVLTVERNKMDELELEISKLKQNLRLG